MKITNLQECDSMAVNMEGASGATRQLPIGNGILTVETELQARVRASPDGDDMGRDKGGDAARSLAFRDRVQRQRRLSARFRSKNFNDSSAGESADAESVVERGATGRNRGHLLDFAFAQDHQRTLSELLFDRGYGLRLRSLCRPASRSQASVP